jgi:hypothetical protein
MRDQQITRRAALRLFAAAPVAAAVLSACGKKDEPDSCQDVSALSDSEKSGRAALQYSDKSPQPDKLCSGCNFWQPPSEPSKCGGCQLVRGPIHPKGYCTAFAPKAAT